MPIKNDTGLIVVNTFNKQKSICFIVEKNPENI